MMEVPEECHCTRRFIHSVRVRLTEILPWEKWPGRRLSVTCCLSTDLAKTAHNQPPLDINRFLLTLTLTSAVAVTVSIGRLFPDASAV